MKKSTCILLFSRSAANESKHKQLLSDNIANTQLHNVLYNRTVDTISNSNLPVLKIDEHQQVGNSFGERFFNAISSVFAQGYENVIAVGSDCPSLRLADINHAYEELVAGRSCLGPSMDGGAYLIATSKRFLNVAFQQLPWQTSLFFEKFCDLLSSLGAEITLLAKKKDLDQKTQLNTIAYFLKRQLGIYISFFSGVSQSQLPRINLIKVRLFDLGLPRRGPPSCQSAA